MGETTWKDPVKFVSRVFVHSWRDNASAFYIRFPACCFSRPRRLESRADKVRFPAICLECDDVQSALSCRASTHVGQSSKHARCIASACFGAQRASLEKK